MKAILLIDIPNDHVGDAIDVTLYGKENVIHEFFMNRLKLLPSKIHHASTPLEDEILYAQGWNDCLEKITGEKE